MKKCEQCGTTILFGPVREGGHEFCSYGCRDQGVQTVATAELPDEFIYEKASEIKNGDCPKCGGAGQGQRKLWLI
jgi:ssDNA-binding Zn-finger/Zn-ribbon topoisomerase 1